MKLFTCPNCGHPLYFDTTRCESCGLRTGYDASRHQLLALEPIGSAWRAHDSSEPAYRFCANAGHDVCNWLVPADHAETFCTACRHNRTISDLSAPDNLAHWRRIERRQASAVLHAPAPSPAPQLAAAGPRRARVRFPVEHGRSVAVAGHDRPCRGLITLNVAEADDSERERVRHSMGEPYRTLLGHFRHEIAHYYWDHLVRGSAAIDAFRQLFGDERADYGEALKRHYAEGPPPDWPDRFITAYASAHPWEDFAETWAHYFHMVDTLETAAEFGLRLRPKRLTGADLAAAVDFDPHEASVDRIIDAWLPLTFAVNSINRSMGQADLYPFVLAPAVIWKLAFIHEAIRRVGSSGPRDAEREALRAVIAGLKRPIGSPQAR